MSKATRCCRGYTLVEIMVSLVIFSIVILPLTGILVAESKFERSRRQKVEAMLVAKNEVEKCKGIAAAVDDADYATVMGGKEWSVRRAIEVEEGAVAGGALKMQKALITVSVGRINDTAILAQFRIIKETYR